MNWTRRSARFRVWWLLVALMVTALLPSVSVAAGRGDFEVGHEVIVVWKGKDQDEVTSSFWIRPKGKDAAPIIAQVSGTQGAPGGLRWTDLTIVGPEDVAADLIANYTVKMKITGLGAGAHRVPLMVQAKGLEPTPLDLTLLVLSTESAKLDGATWVVPVTLAAPVDLARVELTAAMDGLQVQVGEKPTSLKTQPQRVNLLLPGTLKPGAHQVALRITGDAQRVDGTGVDRIDLPLTVPVTIPSSSGVKVLGKDYELNYSIPFPGAFGLRQWWNRRFLYSSPLPANGVVQESLVDAKRHRTLPDQQLFLFGESDGNSGSAYVETEQGGKKQRLTMAAVPAKRGAQPGQYKGTVRIFESEPVTVTLNVRHSFTWALLAACVSFILAYAIEYFRGHVSRTPFWRRLAQVTDKFPKEDEAPDLIENLSTWIRLHIEAKDLNEALINRLLALAYQLSDDPDLTSWAKGLDQVKDDPHKDQFWAKLRAKLEGAEDLTSLDQVWVEIQKALTEAKVDPERYKSFNKPPSQPEAEVTDGTEDRAAQVTPEQLLLTIDGLPPLPRLPSLKLIVALLGRNVQRWWDWQRERWIASTMSMSEVLVRWTVTLGALVGVLWQTYTTYQANPTFGADLLKDYGGLISAGFAFKIGSELLKKFLGDGKTGEGKKS